MSSSNGILSVECGEDCPWEVISGKINYCFVLFFFSLGSRDLRIHVWAAGLIYVIQLAGSQDTLSLTSRVWTDTRYVKWPLAGCVYLKKMCET